MSSKSKPLLIELGTEELPPKSLQQLSKAFGQQVIQGLSDASLCQKDVGFRLFASPRRLAIFVNEVAISQEDSVVERRGPAASAAFDVDGHPTPAASGFARSCGVEVSELETAKTEKGEWLVFRSQQEGLAASQLMPDIVDAALRKLPIPKRMRWGDMDAEFVRPVHWLLMLHGKNIIEASLLTLDSGRETSGHRFHHPGVLSLKAATDYENILKESGYVIANFEDRQAVIIDQVNKLASDIDAKALLDPDLLDEVTALVEWPNAMLGHFDKGYLQVPQEALISAMQDHQKYFPVVDESGNMTSSFIFISILKA